MLCCANAMKIYISARAWIFQSGNTSLSIIIMCEWNRLWWFWKLEWLLTPANASVRLPLIQRVDVKVRMAILMFHTNQWLFDFSLVSIEADIRWAATWDLTQLLSVRSQMSDQHTYTKVQWLMYVASANDVDQGWGESTANHSVTGAWRLCVLIYETPAAIEARGSANTHSYGTYPAFYIYWFYHICVYLLLTGHQCARTNLVI